MRKSKRDGTRRGSFESYLRYLDVLDQGNRDRVRAVGREAPMRSFVREPNSSTLTRKQIGPTSGKSIACRSPTPARKYVEPGDEYYGTKYPEVFRLLGQTYVRQDIERAPNCRSSGGAKPTTIEFSFILKAAKQNGLKIPPTCCERRTEVIKNLSDFRLDWEPRDTEQDISNAFCFSSDTRKHVLSRSERSAIPKSKMARAFDISAISCSLSSWDCGLRLSRQLNFPCLFYVIQ